MRCARILRTRDNGGPLITINKVIERTAATLKINKSTVVTIAKEKCELQEKEEGDEIVAGPSTLVTPGKKRSRPRTVTKWDTFQEDAIRRHFYAYYQRKEHPTLNKLLVSLKHADLFRNEGLLEIAVEALIINLSG